MQKFVFLILLISLNKIADSQTWIDSNATWHYNLEELSGLGIQGFYKYTYNEDTIIDGINCQKIACKVYEFYTWPEVVFLDSNSVAEYYTYVSNDTVYYRNNDEFFVLFDFGASIGDTWIISTTNNGNGFCDDTSMVQVVDTGTVTINSQVLRTITLEPVPGSSYGLSGVYNEKFGLMSYGPWHLFPRVMECDTNIIVEWYYTSFKCFEDDSFGLFNPSGTDCEYLLTHLGISNIDSYSISMYPNPVQEKLFIQVPEYGELSIVTIQGEVLLKIEIQNYLEFDLSTFEPGIYFVQFRGQSLNEVKMKLVKI